LSTSKKILEIPFDPQFYSWVAGEVKVLGLERTKKILLKQGFTESQIKIITKRVISKYGW